MECGKRGVWKMRSVENAECGKCGVWKMQNAVQKLCITWVVNSLALLSGQPLKRGLPKCSINVVKMEL